jgi:hypothetical protein
VALRVPSRPGTRKIVSRAPYLTEAEIENEARIDFWDCLNRAATMNDAAGEK